MTVAEKLEARARAELEMFFLASVEEGVLMLAAMSLSSGTQESSERTMRQVLIVRRHGGKVNG